MYDNLFLFSDIAGQVITMENTVDWVQVVINVAVAFATIAALYLAINNARETARFSEETLREDRENRKDDVRPILQVKTRHQHPDPSKDSIYLKNAGQGPLFDFGATSSTGSGILAANVQLVNEDDVAYYVVIDASVLKGESNTGQITYRFKDMYGRRFKQTHVVKLDGNQLRLSNETNIPTLLN